MAINFKDIQAVEFPKIDPLNLSHPEVIDLLDTLIQSILCGEDPTIGEATEEFRKRIESYAINLEEKIYTKA